MHTLIHIFGIRPHFKSDGNDNILPHRDSALLIVLQRMINNKNVQKENKSRHCLFCWKGIFEIPIQTFFPTILFYLGAKGIVYDDIRKLPKYVNFFLHHFLCDRRIKSFHSLTIYAVSSDNNEVECRLFVNYY